MKIRSLTKEKVEALRKEYDEKRVEYELLGSKKITDMWLDDLSAFQKVYSFSSIQVVEPVKKLILKKAPAVKDIDVSVPAEAPKKKLLIKKKPVTMDMFINKEQTVETEAEFPLVVQKKKLIRKSHSVSEP